MHHLAEKTKHVLIVYAVIVAVAALGVFAYFYIVPSSNKSTSLVDEMNKGIDIQTYSMSGTVVAISESTFTLNTGWVEKTDKGNEFVHHDKTVAPADNIELVAIIGKKRNPIITNDIFSFIRVGDKVAIYTTQNPYSASIITADKIEVVR